MGASRARLCARVACRRLARHPQRCLRSAAKADTEADNEAHVLVLGVDPDVNGALAVLRRPPGGNNGADDDHPAAEVHDVPTRAVTRGGSARARHDYAALAALVRRAVAPPPHGGGGEEERKGGAVAYVEEGSWRFGFTALSTFQQGVGVGAWCGALAATGVRVVPVQASRWKAVFGLAGSGAGKDDSRRVAAALFPAAAPLLERARDHGRAEALLIAAYADIRERQAAGGAPSPLLDRLDDALCEAGVPRDDPLGALAGGRAAQAHPEYFGWSAAELAAELRRRGMRASGAKAELLLRLVAADEDAVASGEDPRAAADARAHAAGDPLGALAVAQLKDEARLRDVPVTGAKAELLERLRAAPAPAYASLPAARLKEHARARLLKVSGTKSELAERLEAFDRASLAAGPEVV